MRDINRIDPFLTRLGEFWKQYPDLRFGQIITIIQRYGHIDDFFYYEEDFLTKVLDKIDEEHPAPSLLYE